LYAETNHIITSIMNTPGIISQNSIRAPAAAVLLLANPETVTWQHWYHA
jgi:hypothetical protein